MFGFIRKPSKEEIQELIDKLYNDLKIIGVCYYKGEIVDFLYGDDPREYGITEKDLINSYNESSNIKIDKIQFTKKEIKKEDGVIYNCLDYRINNLFNN